MPAEIISRKTGYSIINYIVRAKEFYTYERTGKRGTISIAAV